MSGYREHSYDPMAYEQMGRPMRPYSKVQWTGVALVLAGLGIDAVFFAGEFGWMRKSFASPGLALAPLILGIALINSRRYPNTDPAPELASARKRWLLIVVALCFVIFGAAAAIQFSGV